MKNNRDCPNPFIAKTTIQGSSFWGRKELLKKLFYYVNAGEAMSLIGERRTGKTSVLMQMQVVKTPYLSEPDKHLRGYATFQDLSDHIVRISGMSKSRNMTQKAQELQAHVDVLHEKIEPTYCEQAFQ